MFDAKSILDHLVRGAAQGQPSQAPAQGQGGGLGDIFGQLGQVLGAAKGQGGGSGGGLGGLEDILKQVLPQGGSAGSAQQPAPAGGGLGGLGGLSDILRNMVPSEANAQPGQAAPDAQQGGEGGIGDILGKLQEQLGGTKGGAGGRLMDILGQVLGQATQGVKEGAGRIDDATGASGHMRDAIGQATGKSPDDILAQIKDLIANNQLGAGAAAGGLGALVLGTKAGRAIAGSAIKLGALALIGGLAYKAMQNYQAGKPVISGADQLALQAAPDGSGFEAAAVTNEAATGYIRAMIAAAAADGRIDAEEQQRIIGGLKQAGFDAEAEEFLANELANPASIEDLAGCVSSGEEAVQLFTAARIAIDLDTEEEHDFLVGLAQALEIDGDLVAHIDGAARAAA